MSLLDKLPDSAWFFCFPMSLAVMMITALGILHPLFWLPVWRVYRSELFVFMYVLVGFWSLLSCALLYGILAESSCLYVFWIYYTIVFSLTMAGLMFLLFCGFCVLGMKRKSITALVGLIYYLVTIYFAIVVNMQRKEVFGLNAYCGACPDSHHVGLSAPKMDHRQRAMMPMTIETTTREIVTANPALVNLRRAMSPQMNNAIVTNGLVIMVVTSKMDATAAPQTTPTAAQVPEEKVAQPYFTPTHQWNKVIRRNLVQAPGESNATNPATTTTTEDPLSAAAAIPSSPDRGLAAIARLADILINSNDCRKPLKPSHGRYVVGEEGGALQLALRCDQGYRETSETAECRQNWWNKPLPQCRKRKSPEPATGCTLPGYPEHGEYTVVDNDQARPGDDVGDSVILSVTCDAPYRPVDPYVICNEGRWRNAPPNCQRHCRLTPNPTVEYRCLDGFKDDFVPCGVWQPAGALVVPECARGHAHRGPFRYMRCKGTSWTHVVQCTSNFTYF